MMDRRRRAATIAGLASLAIAGSACLASCGQPSRAATAPAPSDPARRQAQAALDRWASAVQAAASPAVVPVGELTGQIGDWETDRGDNKAAFMVGKVIAAEPLSQTSRAPPATGTMTLPDGTTQSLPLVSPVAALQQIADGAEGDCAGCAPLRATHVRLTQVSLATSRGTAQVPAWAYTIEGTRVQVTRVAIDPRHRITATPPSWNADDPPQGLTIEGATTGGDDSTLTVNFVGTPGPADQPCGADYTTEAVESDTAVVIIVVVHPHVATAKAGQGCRAVGAMRTATAHLSRPLADRAVLDGVQGLPVSVGRA